MKRTALLSVLLFAASTVCAQQPPQKEPPPPPTPTVQPANSTGNGQTGSATETQPSDPALKPGHPLDPHDVDVLTGKADRETQGPRATPYISMYGPNGYGYMSFGRGGFMRVPGLAPFFFSRGFGRSRGFFFRFH